MQKQAVGGKCRIECDVDLDGRITAVSPIIEQTTGYKAEELIGMPFVALVHFQDLALVKESWQLALKGEEGSCRIRLTGKYGDVKRVLSSSRPRFDNGRPIGLTAVMS